MIDDALEELNSSIDSAHSALKRELAKVRTGRASPEMLDSIRVDYYGTPTPINQMASVSVPEPRMMIVKPWDKTTLQLIERRRFWVLERRWCDHAGVIDTFRWVAEGEGGRWRGDWRW